MKRLLMILLTAASLSGCALTPTERGVLIGAGTALAAGAIVKDDKGNVLKDDRGQPVTLPPGVCMYSLRHTYITQALQDGLTTADVAKHAGTSLAMIEKHYSKFVRDAVRERLERVQML